MLAYKILYMPILVQYHIIQKVFTKKCVNLQQNSLDWSKRAQKGQNFAFYMLKSTPARKKSPTAGCGSCD